MHGDYHGVVDAESARSAYVAVKLVVASPGTGHEWSEVVFGRMESEVLSAVARRVVPVLRSVALRECGLCWGLSGTEAKMRWLRSVQALFSVLDAGAFSSGADCVCTAWSVCSRCEAVCKTQHKFVDQWMFTGLFPLGLGSWWTGVSDAVGFVRDGIRWLSFVGQQHGADRCVRNT